MSVSRSTASRRWPRILKLTTLFKRTNFLINLLRPNFSLKLKLNPSLLPRINPRLLQHPLSLILRLTHTHKSTTTRNCNRTTISTLPILSRSNRHREKSCQSLTPWERPPSPPPMQLQPDLCKRPVTMLLPRINHSKLIVRLGWTPLRWTSATWTSLHCIPKILNKPLLAQTLKPHVPLRLQPTHLLASLLRLRREATNLSLNPHSFATFLAVGRLSGRSLT